MIDGAARPAVRVAIGAGGAFVVTGRRSAPHWPTAAADSRRAAEEVAAAAGPYAQHVHPVVCLLGEDDGANDPPDGPADDPTDDGVLACGEHRLARSLAGRPAVLRAAEVADLALRLETRWAVLPAGRTQQAGPPSPRVLVIQVLLVLLLLLALLAAAPRLASRVTGPSSPTLRHVLVSAADPGRPETVRRCAKSGMSDFYSPADRRA